MSALMTGRVARMLAAQLLLVLATCWSALALAVDGDHAGRAVFVRGEVNAEAASAKRTLKARDEIFRQEIIITADDATARFVMRDRTMLALKPGTRIAITEYQFKEEAPADDKMVTDVVTGGLRALTGLVDKRSAQNVKLKTPVATIGVRGTAVHIQVFPNGEVEITFDFGHGYVETAAGRVEVAEGFTVRVVDPNQLPRVFRKAPDPLDPAQIARRLAAMDAEAAAAAASELAAQLSAEDQVLLLAMLEQVEGIDPDVALAVLEGLLRANPELAETLLLTAVQLNRERAGLILQTAVAAGIDVTRALREVLVALDNPDRAELDAVLIRAVQSGITMEDAQRLLEQLREQGLCQ
jgi:hypothetical protein